MPTVAQPSFAAGELTPALYGRVDLSRYQAGLRQCLNWIVLRTGGVLARPGFQYLGQTKSTGPTRLIPFEFSEDQTYILEFGGFYVRVWRDGSPVLITAPAAWVGGGIYTAAFSTRVTHSGVIYTLIDASTHGTETPGAAPTIWQAETFSAGDVVEFATGYAAADLRALQYVQSADILWVAHASYVPQEVKRYANDNWQIATLPFIPPFTPTEPQNLAGTAFDGSTPKKLWSYVVTAVDVKGRESLPSSNFDLTVNLTPDKPVSLTWDAHTQAVSYNVYRARNGLYGYIGTAKGAASFVDDFIEPIYSDTPPTWASPLVHGNPGVIALHQQRLMFAASAANPELVWGSRSGDYHNFGKSFIPKDDDSIEFQLALQKVSTVRHLLSLGDLMVLTAGSEWLVRGGQDEVLTPSTINPKGQSHYGASQLQPVVVGETALFVQEKGNVVFDLTYALDQDRYAGNDLSVGADHLFKGQELVAWAYARVPFSVVWTVRADGLLLGLTYMREQQVLGWHQHRLGGDAKVVDCAVVSEGAEHVLYVLTQRTIANVPVQFLERMHTDEFKHISQVFRVDAGLAYDGFGLTSETLAPALAAPNVPFTVTGTTGAISQFTADDRLVFRNPQADGTEDWIQCTVNSITDPQHLVAVSGRTIPAALAGVPTSDWARGVTHIAGLSHLEGATVAVLADGSVRPEAQVLGGGFDLDAPAVRVVAGLPFTADLETLDLSIPGDVVRDRQKVIASMTALVRDTVALRVGPDRDHLDVIQQRTDEPYDEATRPRTGDLLVFPTKAWSTTGRMVVQQADPLPATLLSLLPKVVLGGS